MSLTVNYSVDQASSNAIAVHLLQCDAFFLPALSSRVDINAYAGKISREAICFEAWAAGELIGLVAVYCNALDRNRAFITNVSVLNNWQGFGVATKLLHNCVLYVSELGFKCVELEVDANNSNALSLYLRQGFKSVDGPSSSRRMIFDVMEFKEARMKKERDYNIESRDTTGHRYAYNFDFDVMHPFMLRSFQPFFKNGSLLELGSFKGEFTSRFLDFFDDVTCVEASNDALAEAQSKLGNRAHYINDRFEDVMLSRRYDNVVMTHVLEHLDDPIRVLRRINEEWLVDGGRFFLACPNANAPSRQIAVKMGLISHNAAVTQAEAEHGHRITYSLDTLERDATAAGLRVIHRSGVFFKALANFQWDRLLKTDIISPEYMEGCYELGQQYPDLCSSIFLVCENK